MKESGTEKGNKKAKNTSLIVSNNLLLANIYVEKVRILLIFVRKIQYFAHSIIAFMLRIYSKF